MAWPASACWKLGLEDAEAWTAIGWGLIPGPENSVSFCLPADILKTHFGDRWNEETGHGGALRAHSSAHGISGGKIWERAGGFRPGAEKEQPVVVVDVGHGGRDPGKVGIDGSLEKDVNLAIALKLKTSLEQSDVKVVMTRETDTALYRKRTAEKKMADMKARCPDHRGKRRGSGGQHPPEQLSPEEVSRQPGLFPESSKGKTAGRRSFQKRFDYVLGKTEPPPGRANSNYYLLLHVKCPIVIVECGFLSNRKEAALLQDPANTGPDGLDGPHGDHGISGRKCVMAQIKLAVLDFIQELFRNPFIGFPDAGGHQPGRCRLSLDPLGWLFYAAGNTRKPPGQQYCCPWRRIW